MTNYFSSLDYYKMVFRTPTPDSAIACVAIHPTLPILATGGNDGEIKLWNIRNPSSPICFVKFAGFRFHYLFSIRIYCLNFHPTKPLLVSGCHHKSLAVWKFDIDLCSVIRIAVIKNSHSHNISSAIFHPIRPVLFSASHDRHFIAWDISCLQEKNSFLREKWWQDDWERYQKANYNRDYDPKYNSEWKEDYIEKIWIDDEVDVQMILCIEAHSNKISDFDLHHNGSIIASCSEDGKTNIWNINLDVGSMTIMNTLIEPEGQKLLYSCKFHRSIPLLATCSLSRTVVYHFNHENFSTQILCTIGGSSCFSFHSEMQLLLTCDGSIWQIESDKPSMSQVGKLIELTHDQSNYQVAFHPGKENIIVTTTHELNYCSGVKELMIFNH